MGSSLYRPLAVGCRELKTRLGAYMRQVKAGATLIVTERGRPIAEVRPVAAGAGLEERLYQLAARGLVSREVRESAPLSHFRPITTASSVSQALVEERDDRF
ncbi:MAG TPA: type II toxin-antitoxin system prevent-host-death family antitoxin [Thermoanaerobaculia bacterium]|nr:type II toxin-antitoxin system prevent-host-death family antitoxin [Thermoanaerobaculia bacterium]